VGAMCTSSGQAATLLSLPIRKAIYKK